MGDLRIEVRTEMYLNKVGVMMTGFIWRALTDTTGNFLTRWATGGFSTSILFPGVIVSYLVISKFVFWKVQVITAQNRTVRNTWVRLSIVSVTRLYLRPLMCVTSNTELYQLLHLTVNLVHDVITVTSYTRFSVKKRGMAKKWNRT
jgi:hypothetical protein